MLSFPQGRLLGCCWRRCLVGSYRGGDAVGIRDVAVRVYARSGLDDKCLADWLLASGQGISGGRQLISSFFFRWPEEVNVRAFSCVKSAASKSIKLWHKHFMKMRMKVTVRYLCKVCVSFMAVVVRYHLDSYTHMHTASLLRYYTVPKTYFGCCRLEVSTEYSER